MAAAAPEVDEGWFANWLRERVRFPGMPSVRQRH